MHRIVALVLTVALSASAGLSAVGADPPADPPAEPAPAAPPAPAADDAGKAASAPAADAPPAEAAAPPATSEPPAAPTGEPGNDDAKKPERAPFTSARQMLEVFEIDFSQLRFLIDGRAFDQEERETLLRILQQVVRIDPHSYDAWQRKNVSWAEVTDKPDAQRAEAFFVPCRVKQIDVVPLRTEQVKRFEMRSYYQVRGEIEGSPQELILFCREVPAAWKIGIPIDERAAFWGLFLKAGAPPQEEGRLAPLYFASKRIGWLPDRLDADLGISEAKKRLGDFGFDITHLDAVVDKQRILTSEREGFYQFLAAVQRGVEAARAQGQGRLFEYREKATPLADLLTRSKELRGEWATVEGRVRMATKIMVRDKDIYPRLPVDHYYEVVLFVNEPVRVAMPRKDGGEANVEFNTYPIVVCALSLPPEIKEGEPGDVLAQVTGWYYKLYTYDTQFMEQQRAEKNLAGKAEQLSPLLITDQPIAVIVEEADSTSPFVGPIVLAVFAVVLLIFFYNARRLSGGEPSERPKIDFQTEAGGPRVDPGEVQVDPYRPRGSASDRPPA